MPLPMPGGPRLRVSQTLWVLSRVVLPLASTVPRLVCGFFPAAWPVCQFVRDPGSEGRVWHGSRLLSSRLGRVSFFTSGSENLHRVEKVHWGTRYAITIAFTCNPDHGITDPAFT